MVVAVQILLLFVLFMLAGVLPSPGGMQSVVFRSPVFILIMFALCVSLVVCVVRRRYGWRRIGFYLGHLAVVVILAGAFVGYLWGQEVQFRAPVGEGRGTDSIRVSEEETIDLPFYFAVTDFEVQYYPPDYTLLRLPHEDEPQDMYVEVREVRPAGKESLDLGPAGRLDVSRLRTEDGEWVERLELTGSRVLARHEPAVKSYTATMRIVPERGQARAEKLRVNEPVQQRGWRFYLQSWSRHPMLQVTLTVRKDPGRILVIPGIYALIIGIALICWRKRGGAAE